MNFGQNVVICVDTIRRANMERLLASNSIIKMSPSTSAVFNYYLTSVLLFSSLDFSLKNLTAELFFFVGIICLNTIFKKTRRSTFLKTNGFLYAASDLLLIPLLFVLKNHPAVPAISVVLLYTGVHSLLFEVFSLPIVSIFLEICPENLEGFFMSLIFFLNNFSKNISNLLGTICIYALRVQMGNLTDLSVLIAIHFSISFCGCILLCFSHIPSKRSTGEDREVEHIENGYLAYINTKNSIVLDDVPSATSGVTYAAPAPHANGVELRPAAPNESIN